MESLGGALASPLTPAVREGSELELLVWAPNLPQVFGLRLARNDDFGDCVLVGLLAIKKKKRKTNSEIGTHTSSQASYAMQTIPQNNIFRVFCETEK